MYWELSDLFGMIPNNLVRYKGLKKKHFWYVLNNNDKVLQIFISFKSFIDIFRRH